MRPRRVPRRTGGSRGCRRRGAGRMFPPGRTRTSRRGWSGWRRRRRRRAGSRQGRQRGTPTLAARGVGARGEQGCRKETLLKQGRRMGTLKSGPPGFPIRNPRGRQTGTPGVPDREPLFFLFLPLPFLSPLPPRLTPRGSPLRTPAKVKPPAARSTRVRPPTAGAAERMRGLSATRSERSWRRPTGGTGRTGCGPSSRTRRSVPSSGPPIPTGWPLRSAPRGRSRREPHRSGANAGDLDRQPLTQVALRLRYK